MPAVHYHTSTLAHSAYYYALIAQHQLIVLTIVNIEPTAVIYRVTIYGQWKANNVAKIISHSTIVTCIYMYMSSLTHQTLSAGRTGIWCTRTDILMDHAHLNVPIHLTVNGICHVKGTLWWFSKIDEATELMDSPDHRLWSTLTEVCRSFRPYLGVTSPPPLSVGIRWVECRTRRDLTLSSSASSLSILDVSVVMVLTETERDTCTIEVGRAEKERMEGDVRNWSQHHKTYIGNNVHVHIHACDMPHYTHSACCSNCLVIVALSADNFSMDFRDLVKCCFSSSLDNFTSFICRKEIIHYLR